MIAAVTNFHSSVWSDIENRLAPLPLGSKQWKVLHVLPLLVEFPFALSLSLAQAVNKTFTYLASFSPWPRLADPKQNFSSVLRDARQWEKVGDIESQITLGHGNPDFLFGVATCTYQDSGAENCPGSQWKGWEEKILPPENRSGRSANLFELYKTKEGRQHVIDALLKLGVNSYRFSIEWSLIEPEEGVFNEENLKVYIELCKGLRDHGLTSMVTFLHFSEPDWWHKKGSFGNEANLNSFLRFSEKVFAPLTADYKGRPLVEHFCTINEPAIEAFSRFVRGSFPPGLTFNFKKAAEFLKGALKAHHLVYKKLKGKAPESVKIGIVHQYLKFVPTNPLLFPVTHYLTRLINDTTLNFFRSKGRFEFKMPFVNVSEEMEKPETDFVGLQYYVRPVIGMLGPTGYHAPMTEMPFCEDPEGLYEAIKQVHEAYKVPVIVTENGISTHDDKQRERYIARALYAAQKAGKEIGEENFLGYYLWSLCDNFEWDMGMRPQAFGAYTQNAIQGGNPDLKEGAKVYARILNTWHKTWQIGDEEVC